jgi:hypothetical protein
MRQIEISVTQDDIDHGRQASCEQCPIARAIARAMPRWAPVVGSREVSLRCCGLGDAIYDLYLPPSARGFVRRFDEGKWAAPFTFTLEVPTSCVA